MKQLILLTVCYLIGNAGCFATTIAWDGMSLAADSQMTAGHRKLHTKSKIFYSKQRNAYIAAGGDVAVLTNVIEYFMKDTAPLKDCKVAGEFQALVIEADNNKATFYDHDMVSAIEVQPPFTFGSGDDFALAALICGKTAKEAIEVAAELDVYTGGHITVVNTQTPVKADTNIPESK